MEWFTGDATPVVEVIAVARIRVRRLQQVIGRKYHKLCGDYITSYVEIISQIMWFTEDATPVVKASTRHVEV